MTRARDLANQADLSFDTLTLGSTDAGSDVGPIITLDRNSASPANWDKTGTIVFTGRNDADESIEYFRINSQIEDVADGTENGRLQFMSMRQGTLQETMFMNSWGDIYFQGYNPKLGWVDHKGTTNDLFVGVNDLTAGRAINFPDADGTLLTADSSGNVNITGITTSAGFSGKIHPVNGVTTNYLSLKDTNELNFYDSSDVSQTLHINYDGGNLDLAGSAIIVTHGGVSEFNGDIVADQHLRLRTIDDQTNQWYVYTYTDDTLRFNYNGVGNDEAIFYTNGNLDLATNTTTSVRINSNARTNTGLNVGGASATASGIYVDNSDGSATLDIAVLGSSYGAHGANAGEVWFYSPDNINIGGATGSTNTINLLGGGRKNIEFRNNGVVFYPEVGQQGDMTFPICSVSNNGSGGQYMHVQFQAQGGDMLHIHFLGYDYGGRYRSGGAGGYIYNTAGQAGLYSSAVSGHCVAVYQNIQNRVELVIDTGAGGTGNRWGSYLFFGGTDTITGNSPLTLTQYTWNGSTGRQY